METKIAEIADGIYRLSTFVPDIAPPAGFTFNQSLILGDEPLMFHTGLRKMFATNRAAMSRIIPPERLRNPSRADGSSRGHEIPDCSAPGAGCQPGRRQRPRHTRRRRFCVMAP